MIILNAIYDNCLVYHLVIEAVPELYRHNIVLGFTFGSIFQENSTILKKDATDIITTKRYDNKNWRIVKTFRLGARRPTPFFKPLETRIIDRLSNKRKLGMLLNNTGISPNIYLSTNAVPKDVDKLWFVKDSVNDYTQDIQCVRTAELHGFELNPKYIIQEGVTDLDLFDDRKYTLRVFGLLHDKKLYMFRHFVRFMHYDRYNANSTDVKVHVNHLIKYGSEHRLPIVSDEPLIECISENMRGLCSKIGHVLQETTTHTYQLIGLDYVITRDKKAILIEINANPVINNSAQFKNNPEYLNDGYNVLTQVNIPMVTNFLKCVVGLHHDDCILIGSA